HTRSKRDWSSDVCSSDLRETFPMLLEASSAATIFKIGVLPSQLASLLASVQKIAGQVELPHMLVVRAVGTIYFTLLPASANDERSEERSVGKYPRTQ